MLDCWFKRTRALIRKISLLSAIILPFATSSCGCSSGTVLISAGVTTDKMDSERGDTGGRTRTVFVETGLETATFAEALARRDAPTPDIGVPARTAGGGYAYAAWLARAERLAGTCDRPGSAWLKSAILRALPAGTQTEHKAIRWAQQDNGAGTIAHVIESIARLTDSRAAVEWAGG